MARNYSGNGAVAVGTNETVITLISAATIRPKLYELMVTCGDSPAALMTIFHIERFTAVGTETSGFTPHALNPDDPASLADYGVAHSAEPTYTALAVLMDMAVHQNGGFFWRASTGREFICPATAGNGIGLQSQSSGGTAVHRATMFHEE